MSSDPQPPLLPAKQVDEQLDIFMARDTIKLLSDFVADKKIRKNYDYVEINRSSDRCAFLCRLTFVDVK